MTRRLPVFAAVAAVAAVSAFCWGAFWRAAFSRNPRWAATEVAIETGLAKTPAEIRDITGLREGVNLFSFSAAEARRRLLDSTLNIADAEVSKMLPGTVRIVARDRVPVAKLFSDNLAVDAGGLVFTLLEKDRDRWHGLPRIEDGARRPRIDAGRTLTDAPGTPSGAEARAARALKIVAAAADAAATLPFSVSAIDVSDPNYVSILADDFRELRFVWEEMTDAAAIREAFALVADVMRDPRSAMQRRFDVLLRARKVVGAP